MKAQWYTYMSERHDFVSRCARELRERGHDASVTSHCQMVVDGVVVELRVGGEGVLAVWHVKWKDGAVSVVDLEEVLRG
ncbi:MAG: hypothetical protein AAFW98_05860 [Pseudomonadota bacterium]